MLDEICPIQFVEGINEYAEATEQYINTMNYSGVAIEYTPGVSFSLKRFDIFLIHQERPEGDEYKVALCPDHDNNPSDIVLSKGGWAYKVVLGDWQEVEFEKPAVIIRNKKYWLTIDLDKGNLGLPIAKEGEEYALRFRKDKTWLTWELIETGKVMLRFYGRILPVFS